MNREVTTAATVVAASALLAAVGVPDAGAQLVYDSFGYPAATSLDGKVNPIDGQPWARMSSDELDDDILVTGGSLSYPGLSAPSGNSIHFGGGGKSQRIGFERVGRSGEMYYSLVLRVASLGELTTGSTSFIAGFSDRSGESFFGPTTVGTRLYLRPGAGSVPGAETFNLGVSKNSSFDVTFGTTEYAIGTPLFVVGSYAIVGNSSGTDDVSKLYINPASLGTATPPTSTPTSPVLTAPTTGTDLTVAGSPSLAAFVLRQGSGVPVVNVDELRVDARWARVTPPTGTSWSAPGGGSWSQGANWSTLTPPNSVDALISLGNGAAAPATIDVDVPVALRTVNISSAQPYTLAGAGPLQFSASSGINVRAGSHIIAAPITLSDEMLISVAAGAALNLSGDFSPNGNSVIKAGDGGLAMKHLRAGGVEILSGTIAVALNGGDPGTGRVTGISIAPFAALDLADNDLVIDHNGGTNILGTWTGASYTGVSGLVASGRNGGAWNGSGIRTSHPQVGSGVTTLAVGDAAKVLLLSPGQTATWSGQIVDDTSVLVRYTYGGDANLDGFVSGDDYTAIDFAIAVPGASGYANGDFNYDGIVSADDYTVIDFNIAAQGPPLGAPTAFATAVAAVPEPAGMISFLMLALLSRRRRRVRES